MSLLHLFKRHLSFTNTDPLGAGLLEEIAAEKSEPDAIVLEEYADGEALIDQWAKVAADVEKDPEWFDFAKDEE